MRPYVALILDSFREAIVSRTLWILLVPITLILLGLAPVGVHEESPTTLSSNDLLSPNEMLQWIKDEVDAGVPSPGLKIWNSIPARQRKKLDELLASSDPIDRQFRIPAQFREALNQVIRERSLYDEENWRDVDLDKETEELVKRDADSLSEYELMRRNRLLLQAAYPDFIAGTGSRVVIQYFGRDLTPPIPIGGRSVRAIISEAIIPAITSLLIGTIAVFVAILVTANVIPQLFNPGSLSLLFSKPIFRSLAFLSKFFGGCSFVLLSAAYLNIGMWLIFGLRFDIWNSGWITTIPVFLFLFAVYYSVSAAAGVVWRNAIISIACACIFWLAGFSVALTKGIYEQVAITPNEVVDVRRLNGDLFATTQSATLLAWNGAASDWEPISPGFAVNVQSILGPLYVDTEEGQRLILARRFRQRGFFEQPTLEVFAKTETGWESAEGVQLPRGTMYLGKSSAGAVIAVAQDDIYRLNRYTGASGADRVDTGFFLKLPRFTKPAAVPVGPADFALRGPSAVAMDPHSGRIAVYDAGRIAVYRPTADLSYELAAAEELLEDTDQGAAIAIAGETVVCATVDGDVFELDADSLEPRRKYLREAQSQPRRVVASPDGSQFLVLYHNHTVYSLQPRAKSDDEGMQRTRWLPQRKVAAARYVSDDELVAVHHYHQVSTYDWRKQQSKQTRSPSLKMYEKIYFYVIAPIDRVMPKPGELKNTATYLITGKETSGAGVNRADIEAYRPPIDPWHPVVVSAVFLAVMLGLTCVYIERQDY